jgi:uncharacterized protein (DUF779 family)
VNVSASARASAVVQRITDSEREDLVMVLGTGCCDSTAPFLFDRYCPVADAEEVGTIAGVQVLAPAWLAGLYGDGELEIDVDEGVPNDSFSLESEYDCRFTLRVAGRA